MAKDIDFFFLIGSTYTYLTVMRIDRAVADVGVQVRWRPFNVRQIMIEQHNIPFRGKPEKMRYMWRDVQRRAERYDIPFTNEPPYPVDPDNLANRVGVLAAEEGWCASYAKATYRDWFLKGGAPGDLESLTNILVELAKDPAAVLALANGSAVRAKYDAETETARSLGIFGSPTFVIGSEIFWGDDRLEDALDWSLRGSSTKRPPPKAGLTRSGS
jgi:2-hydroxychromene-2-carboxylate isomerase